MPRPKEFDRQQVLDRAIQLFWERGYEATSIQELVQCMGIQRGSLYNEFGDKRTLFLAALDRYEREWVDRAMSTLRQPGPVRQSIRELLMRVVREEVECEVRRGCLVTNTAVEMGPLDPIVAARAAAMLQRVEQAFQEALRRAVAQGEIAPSSDVRALARFLTSSLQGLRVMSKANAPRDDLEDVVEIALRALD